MTVQLSRILRQLVITAALASNAVAAETAPDLPGHIVPNSVLRVLPRTREDRLYQLHIGLPAKFKEEPNKTYPVVFVTDGYWDFTTVAAIYGNFRYAKNVPDMLIVGLGYAGENLNYDELRSEDLAPMGTPGGKAGHAEKFLEMIETVAIPLLEKEFRADPKHRYLMGCSNGGLFTLYTLFTKPDLFQGYVADSPAVSSVFPYERAFAAAGRTTDARVFISTAENEWTNYRRMIQIFHRRLEKDGVVKGGLRFRKVDNVRHAGTKPEVYTQGLLYVTAPIAPESGVQNDYLPAQPGTQAFEISFWPAQRGSKLTESDRAVLAEHETWLAKLEAEKKVLSANVARSDVSLQASWAMLNGKDQSAVEVLAKESPAVKSGVLTYEIIPVEEN